MQRKAYKDNIYNMQLSSSELPEDISEIDLTIFVACYNEEDNIAATLDEVFAALEELRLTHDVIVVDDGSHDASSVKVEEYVRANPHRALRLIRRKQNVGLGQNFVDAAFWGKGKYYRMVCGDNVEPRQALITIWRHIGEADLIIPYHAHRPKGRPLFRQAISWLYTRMINLLSGYRINYYNGLPIFRRYDVMRWHTYSHGFGFQADMVTRLLDRGATYLQVPVEVYDRDAQTSTALTMKNILSVSHVMLEIFLRRLAKALYGRKSRPATPGSVPPSDAQNAR
jgi:Glycosyltransferases involved in cell wall biogenesis